MQVAEYIKQCKTPEEIRLRFNIPNDFTPEEEEVRKENAWYFLQKFTALGLGPCITV